MNNLGNLGHLLLGLTLSIPSYNTNYVVELIFQQKTISVGIVFVLIVQISLVH